MSYQKFDLGLAIDKLKITWVRHTEQPQVYSKLSQELAQNKEFLPSPIFLQIFELGKKIFWDTAVPLEELRKTRLIWPFLLEAEQHHPKLRIWERISLDADASQDLTGEPDYCVTKYGISPKAPFCIIMEAKKEDFSQGWGQALAAMRGSELLNEKEGFRVISIYGVVTTGDEWQFGKLQDNQFVIYPKTGIKVLENDDKAKEALSLLDIIFETSEKNL